MSNFVIKVCGITSLEDAVLSVTAGANALGFNFYPGSPRFIEPAEAAQIIEKLPQKVLKVGVAVTGFPLEVHDGKQSQLDIWNPGELELAGFGAIQIHGASSSAEVPDLKIRTFVATSPERASEFPNHEIVVDTSWGSGTLADWDLILKVLDRPYILSGGLTPENVGEALQKLRPDGVDVCSGVEKSPGRKDPSKLESFLSIARSFCNDPESNRRNKEN